MKPLTKTNALVLAGTFVSAGGASLAAGALWLGAVLALAGVAIGALTLRLGRKR